MRRTLEPHSRHLRLLLLLGTSAVLSAAAIFYLWRVHPDPDSWRTLFDQCRYYLEAHPWALALALASLPGLGFPVSPLLILLGVVLGPLYGITTASLIGVAALAVCTTWTYALTAGPLRGLIKRTLLKNRCLPDFSEQDGLRFGFIVRITPGIPYALQNVVLGVMGLRFKTYLMVSIPVQSLYAIGFVVTGGAIFEGRTGLAVTGALLLVVVILATRMFRRRTKVRNG